MRNRTEWAAVVSAGAALTVALVQLTEALQRLL
jgi:hypothetical protein